MWKAIIAVIIVALVGAGGYLYYQSNQNRSAVPEENMVTVTPVEEATPTPEEVDREAYDIEVQNGSGIAGLAGQAQQFLEDAGFTVIDIGNADETDYEETVIYASEDVDEAWLDELKDVLGEEYDVQSQVEELDMETDADVVVIIGSNDASGESMSEEEPTAAPTEEDEETETPTPSPSE